MALKPGPVRDVVVLVVVFGVLLGGLYLFTGTWPPAVIVESSSMMHKECAEGDDVSQCNPDVRYGRIGTIDPGDLVLVKDVDEPDDVTTLVEGGKQRYGTSGDVIVYFPYNDKGRTPIIHRAVAYVEVVKGGEVCASNCGQAEQYKVRWAADAPCEGGATKDGRWCVYGKEGVYAPSVPIQKGGTAQNPVPYLPEHTGFLTKGDNPFTNRNIDQVSGLSPTVKLDWVEGKGRGELPWLGLIKLSLSKTPNERSPSSTWTHVCIPVLSCPNGGGAYAPKDLWVMLSISLFVLVGVPLIYDGYRAIKLRRGGGKAAALVAPHGVQAVAGAGEVSLGWSKVDGASVYRIYRGPNLVGTTAHTTFAETGLAPGLTYVYVIVAVDAQGSEGPRSRGASAEVTEKGPGAKGPDDAQPPA